MESGDDIAHFIINGINALTQIRMIGVQSKCNNDFPIDVLDILENISFVASLWYLFHIQNITSQADNCLP